MPDLQIHHLVLSNFELFNRKRYCIKRGTLVQLSFPEGINDCTNKISNYRLSNYVMEVNRPQFVGKNI